MALKRRSFRWTSAEHGGRMRMSIRACRSYAGSSENGWQNACASRGPPIAASSHSAMQGTHAGFAPLFHLPYAPSLTPRIQIDPLQIRTVSGPTSPSYRAPIAPNGNLVVGSILDRSRPVPTSQRDSTWLNTPPFRTRKGGQGDRTAAFPRRFFCSPSPFFLGRGRGLRPCSSIITGHDPSSWAGPAPARR